MQLFAIVGSRIVKQRIPVGEIVDRARMKVQRSNGIEDHQGDGCRGGHFQKRTEMQDQLALCERLTPRYHVDGKPVQCQRNNGHERQVQPVVGRRMIEAQHARTALDRDAEALGTGATIAPDIVGQLRSATKESRTVFDECRRCVHFYYIVGGFERGQVKLIVVYLLVYGCCCWLQVETGKLLFQRRIDVLDVDLM